MTTMPLTTEEVALKLEDINTSEVFQIRSKIDEAHVQDFVIAETFPPITVYYLPEDIDLEYPLCIDGHHRLLAHSILDNQDIQCRIFEGSYDEAVDYAFQANLTNGLPLTIKEKKLYASKLLTNHPEMSSRAIGRLSGLSHDTVQDLRNPSTNPPSKPKIARPVIEKILNLAWDMKFSKDENPVSEGRTFLQSWDEDQQEHYREAIVNLINVLADVDDLG